LEIILKHDYDKILTRLTQILSKLYQGEQLQPKDLADEFNVSLRTIQRDFKDEELKENNHDEIDKIKNYNFYIRNPPKAIISLC
jgi:transcriptional antiterminator